MSSSVHSGERERLAVEPLVGVAPEIGRALWVLEETRNRTKRVLSEINQQTLDWQGTPGTNSIGSLLYHIAGIEMDWLYSEVLLKPIPGEMADRFPVDARDDQGRLSRVEGDSLEVHFERLDHVRSMLRETFVEMSLDDFLRVRTLPRYDVSPEWVLVHLVQHEAQHRGEMVQVGKQAMRTAEPR